MENQIKNSFVLFGKSGSGKTYFINELIKKAGFKKIFAIDFKNQIQAENIERLINLDDLILRAKTNKNSAIIIDDASGIIKRGNSNSLNELIHLISVRRHDNNYYIMAFHSIYMFPVIFEPLIDYFVFFEISEKMNDILKYFSSFTEEEAKACVMKKGLFGKVVIKK